MSTTLVVAQTCYHSQKPPLIVSEWEPHGAIFTLPLLLISFSTLFAMLKVHTSNFGTGSVVLGLS